jgi:hypothetical protein
MDEGVRNEDSATVPAQIACLERGHKQCLWEGFCVSRWYEVGVLLIGGLKLNSPHHQD